MTSESLDEVKPWMQDNAPKYPILIEESGHSNKVFGVGGIPHAFLIGIDGKLLWEGHPAELTEPQIEKALVGAQPLFEPLAGPLASVQALLDGHQDGKALALLQKLQQDPSLDSRQRAQASFRQRPLDRAAAVALAQADKNLERNRTFDAVLQLQDLNERYEGSAHAATVQAKLKQLAKDGANRREVDACVFLAKARQLEDSQHYDDAYSTYRRALIFSRTKAESFARDAMERIDKEGLRGFQPDCADCKAEGKACKKHKRR